MTPVSRITSYFISSVLVSLPFPVYPGNPLPSGPAVIHGKVSHEVTDKTMTINQTTSKAIVQYNTFDIDSGHGVTIHQPSSSSALLARIAGADRSVINGILQANGRVYISNPNGIIFGRNATINVGTLLATTLNIGNSDFLNGVIKFQGDSQAAIENRSQSISAQEFVALVGNKVENTGAIHANQIVLTAASDVTIDNAYGGTISVDVSGLLGSVNNEGALVASESADDGTAPGSITMKGNIVTHSGEVIAQSSHTFNGGYIEIHGDKETIVDYNSIVQARGGNGFIEASSGEKGTTLVHGALDASGRNVGQEGGEIRVLGDRVGVLDEATINATGHSGGGRVLIGGDYQGDNSELQNASRTYVSSEATVTVDALEAGEGGEVVVWSEEATGFYGKVRARGGANSGNGGFVEISGKSALDYDGVVNVRATNGNSGTVLFDPISGVISDADGTEGAVDLTPGAVLFADTTIDEPWNVTPAQLDGVGGNILLQFNNNLTIDSDVVLTTPGATLTVEVGDDIILNANIITDNGAISLTANHPGASEANMGTRGEITMAGGTAISAGNQPVTLSAEGNVSVSTITTTGDVTITSTSGSIADINGPDTNISANNLAVSANNGINLDTTIANMEASVTGTGNIDITETDSLTLTNIDTANGAITFVAGSTITAIDVESMTDSDGNDIALTSAGGDIEVGLIDTGGTQGDVVLGAQGGTLTDDGDGTVDVIADVLIADATDGIDLDINAASIDASNGGTGSIQLTETDEITLTDVDTSDGAITVIAGDTVTATDVESLTDSDGNDIAITSTGGGIQVGLINAGGTQGDVVLNSQGGSIADDGDGSEDIIADSLTANGVSGIDLDTTVVTVNASTSGVGNIDLTETDGVTLTDMNTTDGTISVAADGSVTAVDITANGTGDIALSTSNGDILLDSLVAEGDRITIDAANSVQEVVADPDIDLATDRLAITAVNGIGDTNATIKDNEGLETQVNVLNMFNSTANNIEVSNTGDLILDNAMAVNADGESTLNTGGDIIIRAASNLTILSPQTGTDIFISADETIDIQANITATSGNIGIRADDDGNDSGDIIHRTGVINAVAGGILMSAVNVTLDVKDDTLLAGGLSASGFFGTITPPNSNFGISILASDDITINEGLITSTGSVNLQADADLSDPLLLTSWPVALTNTAGPVPDGIGAITFNTDDDVGVDTTGAGIQAGGAITLFAADDIKVDQTGMTFTAEATTARSGSSTDLHPDAGFVGYSAETIDLNAADGSTTVIDTQTGSGLILITAGFDFSTNLDVADQQDFGVTNVAGNTSAAADLTNTSILSGSGVELSQSGDIIVDTISADWIHVESAMGSIEVATDAELAAELMDPNAAHGDFVIQLDAATELNINPNAVLDANRDDDADIGAIGLGAGTTMTLSGTIGGDALNATAIEADIITIGADAALNLPANVVVNNGSVLSAESDITVHVDSVVAADGAHLDNAEVISRNGNIVINSDVNGTDEGIFEMTGDSRIVADADNSAAGSLSITADSVSMVSETTATDNIELNSGSTINIISDNGIVIGTTGSISTDINSVAGDINLNANNGAIAQVDGTIVAGADINLSTTGDFIQGADAGGGVIEDAIHASGVTITTSGLVEVGSNTSDDAIEATGAGGITIESSAGSITHSGAGDIEVSGVGNIDIDASDDMNGDITFSGAGNIRTTGGGSILIDSGLGRTISQQNNGALIDSGGSTHIGQTRLPSTVSFGGNGITSDETILVDSSGAINLDHNAIFVTRDVSQNIDFISGGGPLNLEGSAEINATGNLTLTAASVVLNSDSANTEIVAGGIIDITGTSGDVVMGGAGGATDLQAGGDVTIDAVGDVIQNDGSINVAGSLTIGANGTTEKFIQGPDAGDDAIVDAIHAETVSISADSEITIGSNSSDDAIETTGVNRGFGIVLTTAAGDITLMGEGDLESSTAGDSGVSITTARDFEMLGSGDIIASGPSRSDVVIAATGNITLGGAGGILTTGSSEGDVMLTTGAAGAVNIDTNNLGAFIDSEDNIEIGQVGVGSSSVTISGDLVADDAIDIKASGTITINEDGKIQTTGDNLSTGRITITSGDGQINLNDTARIIANIDDLDRSADIVLIADSMLLNSANAVEILAGGDINLTTDNGAMGIQTDLAAGRNVLLSVVGGGDDADIEVMRGLNTANITAQDFIDMRALDDIEIDQSTLTTATSSIYMRANNDGTLGNDTGDSDLFAGGNVIVGTQGANGDVVFDAKGTASDSVIWIAGENIFMENQVAVNIAGSDETDASPINPLTGDSIPFSLALLASENVGTLTNPIQLAGSVAGTFFTLADADLSEVDGGPLAGLGDTPSGTFSHGTGNTDGHLEFNGDLVTPDGNGTINLDPGTNIASGGDIVVIASEDIIQNSNLIANGDILLVSTDNNVIIDDDITLIAGNDPNETTGNITLDAEMDVIIGDRVTIRSGENNGTGDINLVADAAGVDGAGSSDVISIGSQSLVKANGGSVNLAAPNGQITVDSNTSVIAEQDITLTAESAIDVNGILAPEGLLDIKSGESGNPNGEGSFRLGANGAIDLNTSLVFGAVSGVSSSVRIDRSANGPADLLTIEGTIDAPGDIIFDLDGTDSGGLDLDTSVNVTGTLNANGKISVFTQNNQGFIGGGDLNATQVFMLVNGGGDINLRNVTADDWIRLDSESGTITIGGLVNVGTNRGTSSLAAPTVDSPTITVSDASEFSIGDVIDVGVDTGIVVTDINYDTNTITQAGNWTPSTPADTVVTVSDLSQGDAFELTTLGNVVISGNLRANSAPGLNVTVDPSSVTLNANFDVNGDIDLHATDDILVNAVLQSRDGRIILRADDDGSVLPGSSGADGIGDLVMGSGSALIANNGFVDVSGESIVLAEVTAGSTLTVTTDAGGNDDNNQRVTLTGDLSGQGGITITDGGLNELDLVLQEDVTIKTVDNPITVNTVRLDGNFALDINAGAGENADVTLGVMGNDSPLESLTINAGRDSGGIAGTTTLNGSITTISNLNLTGAADVDLGVDTVLTSKEGDILLNGGDVNGSQSLTLMATQGSIHLDTIGGDLTGLIVNATESALLNGDITVTSGNIDFSGSRIIDLRSNVTLSSSGGDIDLGSADSTDLTGSFDLTVDAGDTGNIFFDNVGVETLSLSSANTATLSGDIEVNGTDLSFANLADGDTIILTGDSSIATNGGELVMDNEDVTGDFNLLISTGTGDASLGSIGTTTNLSAFILSSSGTTTLNGAIEADNGIDFSGAVDVDLVGNAGTFTTVDADILLSKGSIDGAEDMALNAGTGEIVLGSIGQNASISSLTIVAAGSVVLDGDITAVGAINMTQDGITLNNHVTLESIDSDISLGDIDASNESLTLIADADDSGTGNVNLNVVVDVANLTVSAGEDITLFNAITGTGTLNFTANVDGGNADNDDDLTITAPISGAQIGFSGIGQEADVIVTADPNNEKGSITFSGNTTLSANVTARDNITFTDSVTLAQDARTVSSSLGDIVFNDDISGDQDLVLNALNRTVTINTIGATVAPTLFDINAVSATLNGGTITTAGNIQLDGVGTTTLATDVVVESGDSDIRLGSLAGEQSLELLAGTGDITLTDGDIGRLAITSSENAFFDGNFIASEDINVLATSEIQVLSVLQSGSDVSLTTDTLDIDGLIQSENSTMLSGTSAFTLAGEIRADSGNVEINSAVTLDADSIIGSNSGDVRFTGDINGTDQNLTINAASGSTVFNSTIGGGTVDGNELDTLIITANNTEINGDVALATGGEFRIQGVGSATTLNANILSASPITIDGDAIIAGGVGASRTITATTDGNDITVSGAINATTEGAESLRIVTTGTEGDVTLEDSVGNSVMLNSFIVDADGETELNGEIRVTDAIDLSTATNIQLGSDVFMTAGNGAGGGVVTLNVVDGAFDFSVLAENDINAGGAIGSAEALDAITLTSTDGSVTIADSIIVSDSTKITSGGDIGEDINLNGNVVSSNVVFDAGAEGLIQVSATQNNSAGSTLFNGDVVIDGTVDDSILLTSQNDMVFNSGLVVTDIGAQGIESVSGNLVFNGNISGADDLSLTTTTGTIELNAVSMSGSLTTTGIAATLTGDISAAALTTTGTGLTTLLNDISIDTTSGNGNIVLGPLAGDHLLTLNAGNGDITLSNGHIGVLSVLAATNVNFDGVFSTSGAITVGNDIKGDITISNSGAVQADGTIELTTTETGTRIFINGDGVEAINDIRLTAVDSIAVNGLVASTAGEILLTSENGGITIGANLLGNDVMVITNDVDGDDDGDIVVSGPLDNDKGGYILNATDNVDINSSITSADGLVLTSNNGSIQLGGVTLTSVNDIIMNAPVILDSGDSTVTSRSGSAVFGEDINGGFGLSVNAATGTADFVATIGEAEAVAGLVVAASEIELGANVTSDDAVIFNGRVNLDTDGVIITTSDDALTVNSAVTGDQDFTVAVGNAPVLLREVVTSRLDINNTGTTTLAGDITAADAILLEGAVDVDLVSDIVIRGDGNTNIDLSGGDVAGDFNLRIDAGEGMIILNDDVGEIIDVNSLTVIGTGQTRIAGILATDENLDFSAANNISLASEVILANTDTGAVDLSGGAVDGAGFQLTIDANTTDVVLGPIGQSTTTFGIIDVNSTGQTRLEGSITTNNADILLDGATNVELARDLAMSTNTGGGNIDFAEGGTNSLSGNFDLDLNAGTGNIELDNGGGLKSLEIVDSTATTISGTFSVNGAATINATSGIDDVDAVITVDGALTADSVVLNAVGESDVDVETTSARITLNGPITSSGSIDLSVAAADSTNDVGSIDIMAPVTASRTITAVAKDNITTSALLESTGSNVSLAVDNGDVTTGANIIGDDVVLTSANGNIVVNDALNNNLGGLDIDAPNGLVDVNAAVVVLEDIDINGAIIDNTGGQITGGGALEATATNRLVVGADVTADNDIVFSAANDPIRLGASIKAGDNVVITDDVLLTAESGVTTTSGDVMFDGDINGEFGLSVNAVSGIADFDAPVGNAEAVAGLTVSAARIDLGGNVTSENAVVLSGPVNLDTNAVTITTSDDAVTVDGAITGNQDFAITVGNGLISLLGVDTNSLDINNTGTTTLGGDITVDDAVLLDDATDVDLRRDIAILGDGDTGINLSGGDIAGDVDLEINSGMGSVTLNGIDVNLLKVQSIGTTTVTGDLTTDEGLDLSGAVDVDIATDVTLTNTQSGVVDLSGGDVDAAGGLNILASDSNVRIGVLDVNTASTLKISSSATTELLGSINTAEGTVDFSEATTVILADNIQINTSANEDNDGTPGSLGADIIFQDTTVGTLNSLSSQSGNFNLTLDAGLEGDISFGDVALLSGLTIHDIEDPGQIGANDVAFNGRLEVNGPTTIFAGGTVTGGPTAPVDDNFILSSGRVVIRSGDDIVVSGDHFIRITATGIGVGEDDGDIIIGAVLSADNGEIQLTANDDIVFERNGRVISNGLVSLTANADASDDTSGIFELDGENEFEMPDRESEIVAGNLVMSVRGEKGFIGAGINPDNTVAVSSNDYFEIDSVATLTVEAEGSGSIHIADLNDITITDFENGSGGVKGGTGDVNIVAGEGLRIGDITTSGDVTLDVGGSVNDSAASNNDVDIIGSSVTLASGLGIGNVSTLTLNTRSISAQSTSGNISLLNRPDPDTPTTIENLQTVEDGDITLTQEVPADTVSGGLIISNASTSRGNLEVTNKGNDSATITLGSIDVDGDVTITTDDAGILDDANDTTMLKGELLTLTALTGAGIADDALETEAERLDVSVTEVGNINIDEVDGVELLDIDTADGSITLRSRGDTTITDVESGSNEDGNDINLEIASGSAVIGRVDAKDLGDVTLTVGNGSILKGEANSLIKGADLTIDVSGGSIGNSTDPISTEVTRFLDIVSDNGNIHLTEVDSVAIESVSTSSNVSINADAIIGDANINDIDISASAVELETNLSIGQLEIISDIEQIDIPLNLAATSITAQTSATGGLINLSNSNNASTTINLTTSGSGGNESITFTHTGADPLTIESAVTADGAIAITASDASIIANSVSAGGSENDVTLTVIGTAGGILVDDIQAVGDSIILESSGSIAETDDDPDIDLMAPKISLVADGNIGNDEENKLELQSVDIQAETSSGSINLMNRSNVQVTVSSLATQGVDDGSITFEQVGGGDVVFRKVTAENGNITLKTLSSGKIFLDEVAVSSNGHKIEINSADAIEETADIGDPDADLTATVIELRAHNGIGIDDAIELDVTNITATTDGNSDADINLNNVGDGSVTLAKVTTEDGSINFTANGPITVRNVKALDDSQISGVTDDSHTVSITSADGDITLEPNSVSADFAVNLSTNGTVADGANTNSINIVSGGNINLNVGDRIGVVSNPLDIDATGDVNLTFNGSGSRTPVWAMLSGRTSGGSNIGDNVRFRGAGSEPPGLIIWNGNAVGGKNDDLLRFDRVQSYHNEIRNLTREQAVFVPAFFRHVMVSMNQLWKIPSIEYLNIGGGFIFGLPKSLNLPPNMNVLRTQDESYQWYSLPFPLSDSDSTYF